VVVVVVVVVVLVVLVVVVICSEPQYCDKGGGVQEELVLVFGIVDN